MKKRRIALLAGNEWLGYILQRFADTFPENYTTRVFTALPERLGWAGFDYAAVEEFQPDCLLVWNASASRWRAAARMCDVTLFGGGRLIEVENAWFPQAGNWRCRPVHYTCEAMLRDEAWWNHGHERWTKLADYLVEQFPLAARPPVSEQYVLVVGQVAGDANTEYSGDYFVATADFESYANSLAARLRMPTFFAPHPKSQQVVSQPHLLSTKAVSDATTLTWAQHAAVIVGLSSTVLFESLAYGCRPVVLGRPDWLTPGAVLTYGLEGLLSRLPLMTQFDIFRRAPLGSDGQARLSAPSLFCRKLMLLALALQFPAEQFAPAVARSIDHVLC